MECVSQEMSKKPLNLIGSTRTQCGLTQAKKELMANAIEESYSKKRILRIEDVHGFHSISNWTRKILMHLRGEVEGAKKMDQMMLTVLRSSKTMTECQPQLNTILAELDQDPDLEKVKTRMYNTWSQKCMGDQDGKNISAFFPAYSQMLQYDRIQQDVLAGKNPLPIQENSKQSQKIRRLYTVKGKGETGNQESSESEAEEDHEKPAHSPPTKKRKPKSKGSPGGDKKGGKKKQKKGK